MKVVDLTAARAERVARTGNEASAPLERLMSDLDLGLPAGDPTSIDPYLLRMDAQTGVLSRTALLSSLDPETRRQEEEDRGGTLMGLRVDGLGGVHDASESTIGEVLSIVARRLDRCTRLEDGLGRAGEVLFAIYLRGCAESESREVAARCTQAIEGRPIKTDGRNFALRLVTGTVKVEPDDPRSGQDLLEALATRMA